MNAITQPALLTHSGDSISDEPCKVLLIEDDAQVSELVERSLKNRGYQVNVCHDGEHGLITALEGSWQIILLDIMLPGLDGINVLSRLRELKNNTPVIVLSACGAEQDRINGFHTGADDYLPKPFSMEELQLRMEALLRRCYQRPLPEDPAKIETGRLILSRLNKSVSVAPDPNAENKEQNTSDQQTNRASITTKTTELEVTPVEFELLWQLMKHSDETLSRPYLYQVVLDRSYSRYDRSLDMHISNLRQKLKQVLPGEDLIRTIRGKGYRYQ